MNLKIDYLEEPLLEFRYNQYLEDPHDGLSLFGPYDADLPSHPKRITHGVIGSEKGISLFEKWSEVMNTPIIGASESLKLWPPFPGFDAAFACEWPKKPAWTYELDEAALIRNSHHRDPHVRAFSIVSEYLKAFDVLRKRDETFNVIICVVPDEVHRNCRPRSHPSEAWGVLPRKAIRDEFQSGQVTLFEEWDPETREHWTTDKYGMSVDFRRQIKARTLTYNIPIQIIRESTLALEDSPITRRGMTCLSDRAWNLSTGLFYKAGGKPWRLASAREGVSYIGISFKRTEPGEDSKTACCAAQMFLDSGDGIVFLGDEGPWYSPERKEFQLDTRSAENLLKGVLRTYQDLEGKKLRELFIHCRSRINREAYRGYEQACPSGVKLVGIRVKKEFSDLKLYRAGKMPVLRGTFVEWDDRCGYLWGTGYKPRLETYDGWAVPIPLKIVVQYGNASIRQVSEDILGLTKLNYNACRLADSEPVTILFSDDVGEILISNPKVHERRPQFKFYI